MSEQIQVIGQDAIAAEKRLRDNATKLRDFISSMSKNVVELQNYWEGDAPRAYQSEFNTTKPNLLKMAEIIDKYATVLNQAIEFQKSSDSSEGRNIQSKL